MGVIIIIVIIGIIVAGLFAAWLDHKAEVRERTEKERKATTFPFE